VLDVVLYAVLAAVISAMLTSVLVPLVTALSVALRAVDEPGGRKAHAAAIPRLGGIAIGFGLLFGAGAVAVAQWGAWSGSVRRADLVVLILAAAMVFVVGLVDDLFGASWLQKIVVELCAAVLVVGTGLKFAEIGLPGVRAVPLGLLGSIVAVVWIVGVTNAINLVDGLDGLAPGVVAIIAAGLLVFSVMQHNILTVIVMAGIFGACLGFLRHNRAPAKIFLGDAGSLSLGFVLAVISVHSSIKAPAAIAILIPILALGVPVMDTLAVMVVRFLSEPNSPTAQRVLRMFRADRTHLHFLLERMTGSGRQVVRLLYAFVALSCAAALAVAITKSGWLGLILIAVELLAVLLLRRLGWSRMVAEISQGHRKQLREELSDAVAEADLRR